MKASDEAVYLYCFARSELLPQIEGTGVDGHSSLRFNRLGDIISVTSCVSVEEFCGEEASEMKDIGWLAPRAYRHEKVVEQVMAHAPVLPARFGTVFSSLDRLEQLLKRHSDVVAGYFDQVTGRQEWAVKGYLDQNMAKEGFLVTELAKQAAQLVELSPGKRYLAEQRLKKEVGEGLHIRLHEICNEVALELSRAADGFLERPTLSRDATGMDSEMIVNWAHLVLENSAGEFQTRLDRVNREHERYGLVFRLSGPWPPYSFCPALGS